MELVIDANEVFSMIIAQGKGRQTKKLDILFSDQVYLYAPALLFMELEKSKEDIKAKARFNDSDFEVFIEILRLRIKVAGIEEYSEYIEQARKICPDKKDTLYFALALKRKCILWSGDKALRKQSLVKVINTKELLELL